MPEDERLNIQTDYGELTAIFISSPINEFKNTYTSWFEEFPNIIVGADTIEESIKQLKITLDVVLTINTNMELLKL
jgi:Fic family protein